MKILENLVFIYTLRNWVFATISNLYFLFLWNLIWFGLIILTLIIWFHIINTKMGWKDKWLSKSEFVANILFLYNYYYYYYFYYCYYCLGAEVYCYNLPDMCFEDELVPFFSQAGTIQKLRILVHFSGFTK